MMVDPAFVYLARMWRNSEDIAGEFEVADQLKRVPEEIRRQEVDGRRIPPAGPLLRFEDCRFNAPAFQIKRATKPRNPAADDSYVSHIASLIGNKNLTLVGS